MSGLRVDFRRLPAAAAPDPLPLPTPATPGAAGVDLRAALRAPVIIEPGARARISVGFALALPAGHEGQVRPRSGLAFRHGLTVLNAPGTIDADYRGEVMVLLINHGEAPVTVRRGDRIAQLVVAPVCGVSPVEVEALDETHRGVGGFGHTGI